MKDLENPNLTDRLLPHDQKTKSKGGGLYLPPDPTSSHRINTFNTKSSPIGWNKKLVSKLRSTSKDPKTWGCTGKLPAIHDRQID